MKTRFFFILSRTILKYSLFKSILILGVLFFVYSCTNINQEKEGELKILYNSDEYICLFNEGNSTIEFEIIPNNKDFSSLYDIVLYIKSKATEFPEKSLEIHALEFVYNYTFIDEDIVNSTAINSPQLTISSTGGGLCGTRSAVLTNILIAMGYKARSWCLEGHVVTEVYSNDKWKILDPDYGVYFINDVKQIASYQELCDNPEWFKDAARYNMIDSSMATLLNAFMMNYADIFSSTEDNRIYNTNFVYKSENKDIYAIPKGAELIIPWKNSERGSFYICAKLIIPINYLGEVKIPLVLDKIEGKGKIRLNKKNYKLDGCLTNFIDFNSNFAHITIIENCGLEFYFFINPKLFLGDEVNEFILKGHNLKELRIKKVRRSEEENLRLSHYRNDMNKYVYDLLEEYSKNHKVSLFDSREETIEYLCDTCCSFYYSNVNISAMLDSIDIQDIAKQGYMLNQLEYFLQNKCDCKKD